MFLRWFWLDHVPAGARLSREDRRNVAMHAGVLRRNNHSFRNAHRRYILLYGLLLVAGYVMASAVALWSDRWSVLWVASPPLLLFAWYGQYRTGAPFVWRSMAKVGYETCLSCGYLLQGLGDEHERCPECGETRDVENRDEARARAELRGFDRNPRR